MRRCLEMKCGSCRGLFGQTRRDYSLWTLRSSYDDLLAGEEDSIRRNFAQDDKGRRRMPRDAGGAVVLRHTGYAAVLVHSNFPQVQ